MISKIKKTIIILFILIFVILFTIFAILKVGLEVENLQIANLNISKFFIKLNKKFDLKVDNIKIISNNAPSDQNKSFDINNLKKEILSYSKDLKIIYDFFEQIEIKNLHINDEVINFGYKDGDFSINSNYADANLSILATNNGAKIFLKNLYSNKFKISAKANINANIIDESGSIDGNFSGYNTFGKFKGDLKNKIINYGLYDVTSTDLKPILEEFLPNKKNKQTLIDWIAIRTKSRFYEVSEFNGTIDLAKKDFHLLDLVAKGKIYDMSLNYNDKLPVSKIDLTDVFLKNDTLFLQTHNLKFKNSTIKNGLVRLKNLFADGKPVTLDVALRLKSLLSKDIFSIPASYGIDLPFEQVSGSNNSSFNIFMKFSPKFDIKFNGNFELKNSDILISGTKFHTDYAIMELKKDNRFLFNKINLSMGDLFNIDGYGELNLNKKSGILASTIKSFKIDGLLDMKNYDTDISLDFNKGTNIGVGILADVAINKSSSNITIDNLLNLVPFSKILQTLSIKGGKVLIDTKNFKNYDIDCKNVLFDVGLENLNQTHYNMDNFSINVTPYKISGRSSNNKIKFNIANNITSVDVSDLNYAINTKDMKKSDNKDSSPSNLHINVKGFNSGVVLNDYERSINFTNFSGSINNKTITFDGLLNGGKIDFDMVGDNLKFEASNISSNTLNALIKRETFGGGKFGMKVKGAGFNNLKGQIDIKDTFLKDYSLYQNLLSLINSIPALLTLKGPDFTSKGFAIDDGKIYFTKVGNKLNLVAIKLDGTSANIGGSGWIDFDTKKINIDLQLQFLKSASSIIDKIPLINYMILGKDKSISTLIKVRGTLDKPEFSTGVIKGILKMPFDIIKNTLSLPFVVFK